MGAKKVHRISAIDDARQVATCASCGPDSPIVFRQSRGFWVCLTGRRSRRPGPRRRAPEQRRQWQLKEKFGITVADYGALMERQAGLCAICQSTCSSGRSLAVDHDHATGKVRGLLCGRCNTAIGLLGDDPQRLLAAASYLT